MVGLSYKQLHPVSSGKSKGSAYRISVVSYCIHDYIVCTSPQGIALYNFKRYLKESDACSLRRDKRLPDFSPDVQLDSDVPVCWISYNSDQLTLTAITSSHAQGTVVYLVDMRSALKSIHNNLSSIGRPIRVCTSEEVAAANGLAGLRDFRWHPAISTLFAIILQSGVVRLFDVDAEDANKPTSVVAHWPATVGARCLSWSARGKQLAICLTGTLNTSGGPIHGPLIVQTDGQLRTKRMIQLAEPLAALFGDTRSWEPIDLLWLTSTCFVLGLRCANASAKSVMCAVLVHAPTKSTEVTCTELREMRGQPNDEQSPMHYYFQPVGPSHFWATRSVGGEELVLYALPSPAPSSGPLCATHTLSIELPPDGSPIGACLGYYKKHSESTRLSAYLAVCMSSGTLCAYLLHRLDEVSASPFFAIPEPITLLSPLMQAPARSQSIPSAAMLTTSCAEPTDQVAETKPAALPVNFNPPTVNPLKTESAAQSVPSFPDRPLVSTTPVIRPTAPAVTLAVESTPQPSTRLPKSVLLASDEFTNILRSELQAGRAAWSSLFELLRSGPKASNTAAAATGDKSTGVDVIEARVLDTERFLTTLDKAMQELSLSVSDRKDDLINSATYADHIRRQLEVFTEDEWAVFDGQADDLDPEMTRLLVQLKRRTRSLESALFEMDNQLDALLADTDGPTKVGKTSQSGRTHGVTAAGDMGTFTCAEDVQSALDTTSRLVRLEQGRIDYLAEALKRMHFAKSIRTTPPSRFHGSQHASPKLNTSRNGATSEYLSRDAINPDYKALVRRDRALYRLFSRQKPSVIYARSSCPSVDLTEVEEEKENDLIGELKTSEVPVNPVPSNHPQQTVLNQLIDRSAKAASAHSPPVRSPIVASSTKSSTVATSSASATSRSPLAPRIHMGQPQSSPNSATLTKPVASSAAPASQPSSNGFLLGPKTASMSPINTPQGSRPSASPGELGMAAVARTVSPVLPSTLTTTMASPVPGLNLKDPTAATPPPSMFTALPTATSNLAGVSPPQMGFTSPLFQRLTASASPSTPPGIGSPTSAAVTAPPTTISPPTTTSKTLPPPFGGFAVTTQSSTTTITSGVAQAVPVFGSLFGGQAKSTTTTTSATTGSLFSGFQVPTQLSGGQPVFGFGSPVSSTAQPVSTAAPSLFGSSAAAAAASPTTTSPKTTATTMGSLFSSSTAPAVTSSLFGSKPPVINTSPPSVSSSSVTETPTFGGLFQSPNVSVNSTTTTASLFGSLAPSSTSGGLFASPPSTSAAPNTGLFGTSPPTGLGAGLFGNITGRQPVSTSGVQSLFGTAPTNATSPVGFAPVATSPPHSGGGLFQAAKTAPTGQGLFASAGLFGQPASTTTATTTASSGLFSFSALANSISTAAPAISVTSSTATTAAGLFGSSAFNQQGSGGGLFGSSAPIGGAGGTQATTTLSGLFAGASLGLGTGSSQNSQNASSNVFGKLFGSSASGTNQASPFGSQPKPAGPTGGLFNAPLLNPTPSNPTPPTGLFGSSPTAASPPSATGGLFSGLGNVPASVGSPGGFGSRPVFGDVPFAAATGGQLPSAFGTAQPAFGSSPGSGLFANLPNSPPGPGGGLFGSAAAASGGGFAALAAKTETLTFGSLSSGQSSAPPVSPFGTSPSFTQRRA